MVIDIHKEKVGFKARGIHIGFFDVRHFLHTTSVAMLHTDMIQESSVPFQDK